MLDQSGNEIAVAEDLIDQSQKIGVKRSPEENRRAYPVPCRDILCPDVVIQRIHGGNVKMGVGSYLKEIDQTQCKTEQKDEDYDVKVLSALIRRGLHVRNIALTTILVKRIRQMQIVSRVQKNTYNVKLTSQKRSLL